MSLKVLSLVGIVILSVVYGSLGLTNEEIAGIEALRRTYPDLTSSWPSDPLSICSTPAGPIQVYCTSEENPRIRGFAATQIPIPLPKEVEGFEMLYQMTYAVSPSFSCQYQPDAANLTSLAFVAELILGWLPNYDECLAPLPYSGVTTFTIDPKNGQTRIFRSEAFPSWPNRTSMDSQKLKLLERPLEASFPSYHGLPSSRSPTQHNLRRYSAVTRLYMVGSLDMVRTVNWKDLPFLSQLELLHVQAFATSADMMPIYFFMSGLQMLATIDIVALEDPNFPAAPVIICGRNNPISEPNMLQDASLNGQRVYRTSEEDCGTALPDLPAITDLWLRGTRFNGHEPLPDSICASYPNLKHLTIMNIEKINGTLPSSLSACTQLSNFILGGIVANGNVSAFDALDDLIELRMPESKLFGEISAKLFHQIDYLFLPNNRITGTLPSGSPPNQINAPVYLDLSGNFLKGDLNRLISWSNCKQLDLSNNQLSGTLPSAWSTQFWELLKLSRNRFSGDILNMKFSALVKVLDLDFSHNQFTGFMIAPESAPTNQIGRIDLSHNQLSNFAFEFNHWICKAAFMDLSYNAISNFPMLLACNEPGLQKVVKLDKNPLIAPLSFIRQLQSTYSVSELSLSHTQIFGSLEDLLLNGDIPPPNLAILDLSFCRLNASFPPTTWTKLFSGGLKSLSIQGNPDIPKLESLTGLKSSFATQPLGPTSKAQCLQLLPDTPGFAGFFNYDITLFSYLQCQCIPRYYGKAPDHCFSCPGTSTSNPLSLTTPPGICNDGIRVEISTDAYAYQASEPSVLETDGPLSIESCLSDPTLEGFSNCIGSTIYINQTTNLQDLQLQSITQCREGSDGRLCSHCSCQSPSDPTSCYYQRGTICIKCSRGALSSTAMAIAAISIALAFLLVLSPIMFLVLKSSRKYDNRRWNELSLGKRLLYRTLHAIRMGYLTTLVGFLQIMATAVNLKQAVLRMWLMLASGQLSGTGLVCLIPFLRDPMASLLLKLTLPFVICFLVGLSIILGEIIWIISERRQKSGQFNNSLIEDSESPLMGSDPLFHRSAETVDRSYPWTALATSVGLSIVQFFYFSIALTSIEYFVADTSRKSRTGEIFVEDYPWMRYSEARTLRMTSLPFLIFIVSGFPLILLAIILKWGRLSAMSDSMKLYLGSLMEKYHPGRAWWELVRLGIKLLVAVFLKAVNPLSAWRPILTITILMVGTVIMLIALWRRIFIWKRKLENLLDALSYLLLSMTFMARLVGSHNQSSGVLITFFVIDAIFAFSILVVWIHASITETVPRPISPTSEELSHNQTGNDRSEYQSKDNIDDEELRRVSLLEEMSDPYTSDGVDLM